MDQQSLVNPLCIILVNNGSKGDRLVFRYPYQNWDKSNAGAGGADKFTGGGGSTLKSSVKNVEISSSKMVEHEHAAGGGDLAAGTGIRRPYESNPSPVSTPVRNPYSCSRLKVAEDLFGNMKPLQQPSPQPVVLQSTSITPSGVSVTESHQHSIVKQEKSGSTFAPWGSDMLSDLSDKNLSNLLAVNNDLAEKKFELKINGVRFVGHPTLMQHPRDIRPTNLAVQSSVKLFHVVFCLNAMASHSTVKCFYDLSKRLGIGLRHEEYRCGYLSREMKGNNFNIRAQTLNDILKTILTIHDEAAEDHENTLLENVNDQESIEKTFNRILVTSKLAELMKKVYEDVCLTGFIRLRINNWVQISFCLPQKIHTLPFREHAPLVEPEDIHICLESIRAYHAVLLIVSKNEILSSLWIDTSTTIHRFVQVHSPSKSLQTIAADADLTLSQAVEIAAHLVYWGKATIIYPLCESNVYVLSSNSPNPNKSNAMIEAFSETFPGLSLAQTMADFSLPMPLSERINPILGGSYLQTQLVQLVSWMLKSKLIIQLHTYIILVTYLDINSQRFNVEPMDKSLIIKKFEHDEEGSDSFSEITDDIMNENSPVNSEVVERMRDESISEADNTIDDELDVENSMEKFKGTLSEITHEPTRKALNLVKSPVSLQDIRMFVRLAKYFTGDFHLEEIMYRENIRRAQLMLLLDKFRDVLITAEYEDEDINFFKHS